MRVYFLGGLLSFFWFVFIVFLFSPDWCGSVSWVSSHKPKGCLFVSRSGHLPGLQARALAGGAREAMDQCFSPTLMFLSLSFSLLPLSLKINKYLNNCLFIYKEKKKERERNIDGCLSHAPRPGTEPGHMPCGHPLLCGVTPNQLSHTGEGGAVAGELFSLRTLFGAIIKL